MNKDEITRRAAQSLLLVGPVDIENDLLGHDDVAETLRQLVLTVDAKASIAMYGRWGSGKSSVGKALERKLAPADCDFVRYDAFKWSGASFHRHFLREVTRGLAQKWDDDKVYASEVKTDISLKRIVRSGVIPVALWWILGAAAALGVLTVVVQSVANGFDLESWEAPILALVAPSAVIGALALIVDRMVNLTVEAGKVKRTLSAPSSFEQFEGMFREIVERALEKTERVVIFIDEIDRCAPDEVIDTLDAIRTFVDIEGVVFVVAADRQALEHALSKAIAQDTPRDPQHPYYSSGGAVLDKVFQYTIDLPAPRRQRLTRVARDLARARGGLWDDLENLDGVVSVLIPGHVRSPRRVKILLNAYAVAYGLLARRMADGLVSGSGPADREVELAKLVCLRVEFPRFADYLPTAPTLPTVLLAVAENDTKAIRRHGDDVRRIARDIWAGDVAVATDITDHASQSPAAESPDLDADADLQGVGVQGIPEEGAVPQEEHGGPRRTRPVDELHRYLGRTRRVPVPGRDLIHLEALGSTYGLPAGVAEELVDEAADDASDAVDAIVERLDSAMLPFAVVALADNLSDLYGEEKVNAIRQITRVVERVDGDDLHPVTEQIVAALSEEADAIDPDRVRLPTLIGLFVGSGHPGRDHVLAMAFGDLARLDDPDLARVVVRHAADLARHENAVATAATTLAVFGDRPVEDTDLLLRDLGQLMPLIAGELPNRLRHPGEDAGDGPLADYTAGLDAVAALLDATPAGSPEARLLAVGLLRIEHVSSRNVVAVRLDHCSPFDDDTGARSVLRAASNRKQMGPWIESVDWTSLPPKRAQALLENLLIRACKQWWSEEAGSFASESLTALSAAREVAGLTPCRLAIADVIPNDWDIVVPTDSATADDLTRIMGLVTRISEHGLLDMSQPATEAVKLAADWAQRTAVQRTPPSLQAHKESVLVTSRAVLRAAAFGANSADATNLVEAVASNADLVEDPDLAPVGAALITVALDASGEDPGTAVGATDIRQVLQRDDLVRAGSRWIARSERTAAQQREALRDLGTRAVAEPVREALRTWTKAAPPSEVGSLILWVADEPDLHRWVQMQLRDVPIDQAQFVATLVEKGQAATNNEDRESVLRAWNVARSQLDEGGVKILVGSIFVPYMHVALENESLARKLADYLPLVRAPGAEKPPYGTVTQVKEAAEALVRRKRGGKKLREALISEHLLPPRRRSVRDRVADAVETVLRDD